MHGRQKASLPGAGLSGKPQGNKMAVVSRLDVVNGSQ